jgi:hypothetical protein
MTDEACQTDRGLGFHTNGGHAEWLGAGRSGKGNGLSSRDTGSASVRFSLAPTGHEGLAGGKRRAAPGTSPPRDPAPNGAQGTSHAAGPVFLSPRSGLACGCGGLPGAALRHTVTSLPRAKSFASRSGRRSKFPHGLLPQRLSGRIRPARRAPARFERPRTLHALHLLASMPKRSIMTEYPLISGSHCTLLYAAVVQPVRLRVQPMENRPRKLTVCPRSHIRRTSEVTHGMKART